MLEVCIYLYSNIYASQQYPVEYSTSTLSKGPLPNGLCNKCFDYQPVAYNAQTQKCGPDPIAIFEIKISSKGGNGERNGQYKNRQTSYPFIVFNELLTYSIIHMCEIIPRILF